MPKKKKHEVVPGLVVTESGDQAKARAIAMKKLQKFGMGKAELMNVPDDLVPSQAQLDAQNEGKGIKKRRSFKDPSVRAMHIANYDEAKVNGRKGGEYLEKHRLTAPQISNWRKKLGAAYSVTPAKRGPGRPPGSGKKQKEPTLPGWAKDDVSKAPTSGKGSFSAMTTQIIRSSMEAAVAELGGTITWEK